MDRLTGARRLNARLEGAVTERFVRKVRALFDTAVQSCPKKSGSADATLLLDFRSVRNEHSRLERAPF